MASRRDFFKSFAAPFGQAGQGEDAPVLRPPYGVHESLFRSKCPTCDDKPCVASCDEKIIVIGEDGTPELDFSTSGCELCDDCALACPEGVLSLEEGHAGIQASFRISVEGCMAHSGVICSVCKDPCIDNAILFNGMFNPVIDEERCSGCGFCVGVCPTHAISYRAIPMEDAALPESPQDEQNYTRRHDNGV